MGSVIRFFHPPTGKSYFIFGPRGTGKSTWVKSHYPDAMVIDLLEPDIFRTFNAYPERLREIVEAAKTNIFVIDEIQKAPALLSLIHALIEQNKSWKFILTGSSARKLKREGVDLLAGRAILTSMHPFMAAELGNNFSLKHALEFGLLPLIYESPNPIKDLKTYLALYMKEEVLMEGLVRNIEQFGQFLEVISFSQGSILNYSNIARDCSVNSKTVENYVSILEDLLLCFRLPVFTKRAKRLLTAKPKFYYFDAGVYRAIRPKGPLDAPEEQNGITLETLVAQNLSAWLDYASKEGRMFYWRTKNGLEVDFIIYGEIGFYAIEVKHAKTIQPKDLTGLLEFKKDYPEAECFLLYQGKQIFKKKDITCFPVDQFLLQLKPNDDSNILCWPKNP